jgi:hypothetical protein
VTKSTQTSGPYTTTAGTRLAALLVVAIVAGCSSTEPTPSSQSDRTAAGSTPHATPAVRLHALTKPELAACQRMAATRRVTALCPTRLPRPAATNPPTPVGVYTFHVCQALRKKSACPLYDLAVLYGVPSRSAAKDTPSRFLHFEMLGGRYIPEALSLHGLSGTRPLERLVGTRTIAGHRGRLYFGLPYNRGGGEYGSHYTFVWRQGAWSYAASLHSWTPHTATLKVLDDIISHVGVARHPVHPKASVAPTSRSRGRGRRR